MSDKCVCHIQGYAVKDATARRQITENNTTLTDKINDVDSRKVENKKYPGTSTELYAIDSTQGNHTIKALPLHMSEYAGDNVSDDKKKNYYGTVVKRSPDGRASILDPQQPLNIANKKYVDESDSRMLNQLISGTYRVAKADQARIATETEAIAKDYADNKASEAKPKTLTFNSDAKLKFTTNLSYPLNHSYNKQCNTGLLSLNIEFSGLTYSDLSFNLNIPIVNNANSNYGCILYIPCKDSNNVETLLPFWVCIDCLYSISSTYKVLNITLKSIVSLSAESSFNYADTKWKINGSLTIYN